jgi:hypothetical protein
LLHFTQFGPGSTAIVTITQNHHPAPYLVKIANPAVAITTPVPGNANAFMVIPAGAGTTTLTVSDKTNAKVSIPVTVSGRIDLTGHLYVSSGVIEVVPLQQGAAPDTLLFDVGGGAAIGIGSDGSVYTIGVDAARQEGVLVYSPLAAYMNGLPIRVLNSPDILFGGGLDPQGYLYLVRMFVPPRSQPQFELDVYMPLASGNDQPISRVALSPNTISTAFMAFDNSGDLFMTVYQSFGQPDSVNVYSNRHGMPRLVRQITGPAISQPNGLALDSGGFIYVASRLNKDIVVYPATANGNAKPVRTISSPSFGLRPIESVAILNDTIFVSANHIYALNRLGNGPEPGTLIPNFFVPNPSYLVVGP